MKKSFAFVLILTLSLGLVFANGVSETKAASAEKVIEISLAHANAIDQPIGRYSDLFASMVNEKSGGHIHVTVYPAGQLGSMTDVMDNVANGLQDMSIIDIGNLDAYEPAYAMVSFPMLISSWEQATKVLDSEKSAALTEDLAANKNMRVLGWWWNGFRNMCSKVEIREIADFKGVKFRSPGADAYLTMFSLLNAKPTVIPWGETYSGMQSGIVDGMETTTEALYSQSFYTLGKYILMTRHIFSCNAPVISETLWKSLSAEDQKLIADCMDEVTRQIRAEVINDESKYINLLKESGCEIITLSDQDKLVDLFKPYWSEYSTKNNCTDYLNFIISCK
jgi:tripartite ATP-independent transporter DctP family solute receptor